MLQIPLVGTVNQVQKHVWTIFRILACFCIPRDTRICLFLNFVRKPKSRFDNCDMRIRAVVVEDDAFTLATLTAALRSVDVDVVISVNNVAEAIALSKVKMPNVALLDLHLGKGPSGIDLAHTLRRQNPNIGIVFLTSFDDPRLLLGQTPAFPAKHFYVRKQDVGDLTSLVNVLQLACLGKAGDSEKDSGNPLANLTDPQIEILRMVALGFSNAEIARQKFVQEKSVQVAINRLAKTLGLKSEPTQNQRVHIANKALSAGGYKN